MGEDHAWAAGFYEGEGCIQAGKGISLTISQNEREPLDRFLAIFDCGTIYGPYTKNRKNPIFTYKVSGLDQVERIVSAMEPWLSERRKTQAASAIAHRRMMTRPRKTPEEIRERKREWQRASRRNRARS